MPALKLPRSTFCPFFFVFFWRSLLGGGGSCLLCLDDLLDDLLLLDQEGAHDPAVAMQRDEREDG